MYHLLWGSTCTCSGIFNDWCTTLHTITTYYQCSSILQWTRVLGDILRVLREAELRFRPSSLQFVSQKCQHRLDLPHGRTFSLEWSTIVYSPMDHEKFSARSKRLESWTFLHLSRCFFPFLYTSFASVFTLPKSSHAFLIRSRIDSSACDKSAV